MRAPEPIPLTGLEELAPPGPVDRVRDEGSGWSGSLMLASSRITGGSKYLSQGLSNCGITTHMRGLLVRCAA